MICICFQVLSAVCPGTAGLVSVITVNLVRSSNACFTAYCIDSFVPSRELVTLHSMLNGSGEIYVKYFSILTFRRLTPTIVDIQHL